jgi:hypothetical protein
MFNGLLVYIYPPLNIIKNEKTTTAPTTNHLYY